MSLAEGLQSVAFYVLSCSTCSKISHRRRAKAQAKRERAEKHALETEQPGLYRHPSPFSTNPYWDEEIQLGPAPTKKKGNQHNTTKASTTTSLDRLQSMNSAENNSMATASSPTIVDGEARNSSEDWDIRRYQRGYQREDEELWGRNDAGSESPGAGQRIRDVFARAGNTVGDRLSALEERLSKGIRDEESRSPYFVARNPPVNDLHPPVVSTAPRNKEATKWMLQPPPPAKVMEGKEKATRSRSTSQASSNREMDNPSTISLSRQVTGRAIEERLRRGQTTDQTTFNPTQSQHLLQTLSNVQANLPTTAYLGPVSLMQTGGPRKHWLTSSFPTSAARRLSLDSIEGIVGHDVENSGYGPAVQATGTPVAASHLCVRRENEIDHKNHDHQSDVCSTQDRISPPHPDVGVIHSPSVITDESVSNHSEIDLCLSPAKNAMPTTLMPEASSPNGIDFINHRLALSTKQDCLSVDVHS